MLCFKVSSQIAKRSSLRSKRHQLEHSPDTTIAKRNWLRIHSEYTPRARKNAEKKRIEQNLRVDKVKESGNIQARRLKVPEGRQKESGAATLTLYLFLFLFFSNTLLNALG
jgi:hypothetical protein